MAEGEWPLMTEQARKLRNEQRLAELYPSFAKRIRAIIRDMEKLGYRPRIQDGYRSPAKQREVFESGNSKLEYGFHNVTGPGGLPESLAVDLLDDDRPLDPSKTYLVILAAVAGRYKCSTGILWGLPGTIQDSLMREIAMVNSDITHQIPKALKIGWDPTHIEPTDISVAKAKAGERPPNLPELAGI